MLPRTMTVEHLAELMADARTIVAFTGAGISTESGIPDFRGPQGVWTKLDPNEFTIDNWVNNPEHRKRVWAMRRESAAQTYAPNAAHRALVELETLGLLDCVVTQNIDGLHQEAGSSTVFELHGNTREVACLSCGDRMPNRIAFDRIEAGDEDPHCLRCGGLLKSATISFGQMLPTEVLEESFARAEACDLLLAIGSSLVVYPAAGIPVAAARAGARVAIVNAEPTPMDGIAEVVVPGRAGEVLSAAVELVRARLRA